MLITFPWSHIRDFIYMFTYLHFLDYIYMFTFTWLYLHDNINMIIFTCLYLLDYIYMITFTWFNLLVYMFTFTAHARFHCNMAVYTCSMYVKYTHWRSRQTANTSSKVRQGVRKVTRWPLQQWHTMASTWGREGRGAL